MFLSESKRFSDNLLTGGILAAIICITNASCPFSNLEQALNGTIEYRSIDGSGNNVQNSKWGSRDSTYLRLLPSRYGDGIHSFPESVLKGPLPNARLLSYSIFPDQNTFDKKHTLLFMQYGQIIAHDMSSNIDGRLKCCTDDGKFKPASQTPKECAPVAIPKQDPDYSRSGKTCHTFTRTNTDGGPGGRSFEQLTEVTPFLDLDIIYGNRDNVSKLLRASSGGLLKIERRLNQTWPQRAPNPTQVCGLKKASDACYFASDKRYNQNPELALLEIIYLREHNRLATELSKLNPKWNNDKVYQEARKINIAQHQHIVYYEWLPELFGQKDDVLYRNKIIFKNDVQVNDYDKILKPGVFQEHGVAAFKYLHTLIAGSLQRLGESRNSLGSVDLSDYINDPNILETSSDAFDNLARGFCTQPEGGSDRYLTKQVTFLFNKGNNTVGSDLKTIDIQRSRDHALSSYNKVRQLAGLRQAKTFEDFRDSIGPKEISLLKKFYRDPNDVDLVVGADLEKLYKFSLLGPTYYNIILKQFSLTRRSDRFWYERSSQFSVRQLKEIKKGASISRLICDNSKDIHNMQKQGFVVPQNNFVPCKSLPKVNLNVWKQ